MKRYFIYELKKNFVPILIMTVLGVVMYLSNVLPAEYMVERGDGSFYSRTSDAALPMVLLMMLCTIVPIGMFSFKMRPIQVDLYYGMPIKREKLYLIKGLVGLIIVFVPFTITYWLGFLPLLAKDNVFSLVHFVPMYFLSIPLGILLFGINTFVFTRANHVVDGIIFLGVYSTIGMYTAGWVYTVLYRFNVFPSYENILYFSTYSPFAYMTIFFTNKINASASYVPSINPNFGVYIVGAIIGIAAYVGMFFAIKKEQPEMSGHISDSLFGYRMLIPHGVFVLVSLLGSSELVVYSIAMAVVSAIIGYIIFRRSTKLKKEDWIMLAASLFAGIIASLTLLNYKL